MERLCFSVSPCETAVIRLTKINSTLEMVLENIFGFDTVDLDKGTAEEFAKMFKICKSYPVWREVLDSVQEQILSLREDLAKEIDGFEGGMNA